MLDVVMYDVCTKDIHMYICTYVVSQGVFITLLLLVVFIYKLLEMYFVLRTSYILGSGSFFLVHTDLTNPKKLL